MTKQVYTDIFNFCHVRVALDAMSRYANVDSHEDVLASQASTALYRLSDLLEARISAELNSDANDQAPLD